MAKDFLLEVGCESLPARFIPGASAQILERVQALLRDNRLEFETARAFATPRRLAVLVTAIPEKSAPLEKEVLGPPARILKDESGNYTPQAVGFAKKQGVKVEELQIRPSPKGDLLAACLSIPGEKTADVLKRGLAQAIAGIDFPKTMEWEPSRLRWGRPIRSLTALYGKLVVIFSLAGIRSAKKISGLAAQDKSVPVAEPSRYLVTLKNMAVLADPAERKAALLHGLDEAAREAKGSWDHDDGLIEETVFMTEHPTCVIGTFRVEFLDLPKALLSLVLKKQLKFFPLLAKNGSLLPAFVGVRDGMSEGQNLVREGYERVLEARLNDATFFLSRDKAVRLEERLPMLERVTYHKKLGSLAARKDRIVDSVKRLCESLRAERPVNEEAAVDAARLCLVDLVSDVVKEFPELQGNIGGVLARHEGLDERVALALEEFYFPLGPQSPVPTTDEGALVSLAGKLDALCGAFAVGEEPTGSADPLALRRQALGVIRLLLEKQLSLDLDELILKTLEPFLYLTASEAERSKAWGETQGKIRDFIWTRAQSFLEERGYKIDEIRAIRDGALKDFPRAFRRLAALHAVRPTPGFESLAAAFKRAANILKQARYNSDGRAPIEREALAEEAELALYDRLVELEGKANSLFAAGDYEDGLKTLAAVKEPLDHFFDKVLVMADDEAARSRRLALLARLIALFRQAADISELQVEK